jgi:hypothetical protein
LGTFIFTWEIVILIMQIVDNIFEMFISRNL